MHCVLVWLFVAETASYLRSIWMTGKIDTQEPPSNKISSDHKSFLPIAIPLYAMTPRLLGMPAVSSIFTYIHMEHTKYKHIHIHIHTYIHSVRGKHIHAVQVMTAMPSWLCPDDTVSTITHTHTHTHVYIHVLVAPCVYFISLVTKF